MRSITELRTPCFPSALSHEDSGIYGVYGVWGLGLRVSGV